MKKSYILLCVVLALITCFISCKKEQLNSQIQEYENMLQSDPNNDDLKEKLMFEYVMNDDYFDKVIPLYENNKSLQGKVMCDIYYATALCKMAGQSKDITDQMKYVRKGTVEFDKVIENNPNNPRPYMWQAITYSYFPSILGADELVIEAVEKAEELHYKGTELEAEELKYLVIAYCNIASEFNNASYLEKAEEKISKYQLMNDRECIDAIQQCKKKLKV